MIREHDCIVLTADLPVEAATVETPLEATEVTTLSGVTVAVSTSRLDSPSA